MGAKKKTIVDVSVFNSLIAQCFKQIWKAGKVDKVVKVGKVR